MRGSGSDPPMWAMPGWLWVTPGKLFPPKNPNELAGGWEAILRMGPSARADLGASARARISSLFDIDQIAKRYDTLYHDLSNAG